MVLKSCRTSAPVCRRQAREVGLDDALPLQPRQSGRLSPTVRHVGIEQGGLPSVLWRAEEVDAGAAVRQRPEGYRGRHRRRKSGQVTAQVADGRLQFAPGQLAVLHSGGFTTTTTRRESYVSALRRGSGNLLRWQLGRVAPKPLAIHTNFSFFDLNKKLTSTLATV